MASEGAYSLPARYLAQEPSAPGTERARFFVSAAGGGCTFDRGQEGGELNTLQTLKALVELQAIDGRIIQMEKSSRQIPVRIQEIEKTLSDLRGALKAELNQLDEAEMARRVAESDLRAEKEKIKKWEARLNEVRNNRDYQALSREIESARKANLSIEDEILRKMQEIEELRASTAKKQEQLQETEGKLLAERAELEEKLSSINAQIAQQAGVRQAAVDRVEKRWYQQYQLIRNRRDGVAVVPVLDEHCQGCHMGIPPQLYNLVLKGEEIKTCPHCMRLLYYEAALAEIRLEDEASRANG